jgi:uncharacterized membrane protein
MDAPANPGGLRFERLVFFSDAVMAIAITLLAFALHPPVLDEGTGEVWPKVLAAAPQLQSYIISFLVIGMYWVDHQLVFSYIRQLDNTLIWLNLLFLLLISFLPFPTSLLGSYPNERAVMVLYACTVAATGLLRTAVWWYAVYAQGLVDSALDRRVVRRVFVRGLIPSLIFLASIPVTLLNTSVVVAMWTLLLALFFGSSLRRP